MQTPRYRVFALVLLLGSLPGAPVWAQMPTARAQVTDSSPIVTDFADAYADVDAPLRPASRRADERFADGQQQHERATGMTWSQLSNDQRSMLAPLQSQWSQLAPRRQQRLAERSHEWSQLPPERRSQISERLQRWARMSPEQRQAAASGAHRFRNLPDADRQRLMETYQRFQALPPEQRRALMQQWREQHAKDRGLRAPRFSPENPPQGRRMP